ncbi:MAG: ABC-2 transporter permease [Lawsonibacter sp.]|nr:ABC-2 transporter permease [Lawsonibacter sp.]
MTGLIWKDLLVSMKTIRAYAMVMAIYFGMALMGIFNFSFVSSFLSVMMIMLPIGAFSYDEQAKWERYAMALPLGRRRVVGSRYLFTLVVTLFSGVLAAVVNAAAVLAVQEPFLESMASALSVLGAGLLIVDILLPLCYKLGPERARPYLYALIFLPIIAMFLAYKLGVHVDLSWLDQLGASSPAAVLGIFLLFPLVGVAAMVPSWLISCRIVERKEF